MTKQSSSPDPAPAPGEGQADTAVRGRASRRWQPGSIVADRFRLGRLLGTGAMGDVWYALDLELDETVALKRLREQPAAEGRMADLFRREVRLARRVSHRNVARVFELVVIKGSEGSQLALTMEYVKGHTLSQLLRQGHAFSPAAVVRILRDACAGLGAVHEAGIVHRDLKPGNVMLGEGDRVVLMDFGVALAAHDRNAERGMIAGTPPYMAPELYNGAESSIASDVYALGCLGYELLTGQMAFDAEHLVLVMAAKSARKKVPPCDEVPGLSAILETCLEPDPAARFASAAELEAALARLGAPPAPILQQAAPPLAPAPDPAPSLLTIERERPQLAVLPFETEGVDAGLVDLLVDDFIVELSQRKSLRVLATASVRRVQRERGQSPLSWVDVGQGLGASVVIGGDAKADDQGVEVALRAISVPDGRTLWRWRGHVATDKPLPSMAEAAQSLLRSEHLAAFEGPGSSEGPKPLIENDPHARPTVSDGVPAPRVSRSVMADEASSPRPSRSIMADEASSPRPSRSIMADEASSPRPSRSIMADEASSPRPSRSIMADEASSPRMPSPRPSSGRPAGPPPLPSPRPPALPTPPTSPKALTPPASPKAPTPPPLPSSASKANVVQPLSSGGTIVMAHPASDPTLHRPRMPSMGDSRVLDLYLRGRSLYLSPSGPDLAEAIRCFEEAQAAAPEDPRIASALTVALGRYLFVAPAAMSTLVGRAEAAAEHALRVAPSMGEPHHAKAVILLHRGMPIEAVRSLRRALRCAPSLASSHALLGQLLLEAGHEAEGRQRLVAADRLEPGNAEMVWPLYRFAVLAGRRAEADAAFEAMMRATRGLRSHWALHLRVAAWHRDHAALAHIERAAVQTLAPASPLPAFGAFAAVAVRGEHPTNAYATLYRLGGDEGASMRTRCFHYQVLAEVAGFVGDVAEVARALHLARSTALFDRSWLEGCPLLAGARHTPQYAEALMRASAFGEAMRHAYYSEPDSVA